MAYRVLGQLSKTLHEGDGMKRLLVLGFTMMASAFAARAEDVRTTKKAAIMTPIENLYGRIEARQTSMQWESEKAGKQRGVTSYKLVPRIGTKAFNNRLDIYVETPITNEARTSNYKQSISNYQTTLAAYTGNVFSITPYAQGYLPYNGSDFTSDIAINTDAAKTFELSFGKLSIHGGLEPQVSTGTEPTQGEAIVRKNGALSLKDDGSPEKQNITQREPTTTLEYIAGFAFTPTFAPKLSLGTDAYFDRSYIPTYELRSDETGDHMEKTGYKINDRTLTDVVLTYKADSLTSIQSLTRLRHDGFYAANKPSQSPRMPQIEQRLSLIHNLF
jgi:hypothetical protein